MRTGFAKSRELGRVPSRFKPRVLQVFPLVAGEVDVHGVHGDDRRQQRGAFGPAADEVAARHVQSADPPADRRPDFRELDVELRGADRGFGGGERRDGLALLLRARVELLLGNRSRSKQAFRAIAVVARELEPHLRPRELGRRLLQDGSIRPRIDDEEQGSLFDHAAFVEVDRLQVAADARAHLDGLDGLDTARVFVPVRDVFRRADARR